MLGPGAKDGVKYRRNIFRTRRLMLAGSGTSVSLLNEEEQSGIRRCLRSYRPSTSDVESRSGNLWQMLLARNGRMLKRL
jgi:hypothetical protein